MANPRNARLPVRSSKPSPSIGAGQAVVATGEEDDRRQSVLEATLEALRHTVAPKRGKERERCASRKGRAAWKLSDNASEPLQSPRSKPAGLRHHDGRGANRDLQLRERDTPP